MNYLTVKVSAITVYCHRDPLLGYARDFLLGFTCDFLLSFTMTSCWVSP